MPPRRAIIGGEVVDLPDTEQEPEGSQLREGEGEGEGSQLPEGEGEGEGSQLREGEGETLKDA
jgi:hypothetical protein